MNFTRMAAGATMALAALTTCGLIAGPAGADPTNAKKGQVFNVTCEGLGTVEIATNGSGDWTPVLLTTTNQVLVPYRLHLEFTPVGGETQTLDLVKPAPKKKKAPPKPAKPKRSRAGKVVRLRVVWGVFNNSNQRVATFDYPKRKEAEDKAAQLTTDKKQTHFVQPVKEPIEEKKEKE